MYQIRIGCRLRYFVTGETPAVFILQPPAHPRQLITREQLEAPGATLTGDYTDAFGNRCQRLTLQPGEVTVRYDALAFVPPDGDEVRPGARVIPLPELPPHLLRYTLPSRYAETDELLSFAWEQFGRLPAGWERANGICEWVHRNIEYRMGSSRPDWSAADVLARRQGVCRDRAHLLVALCRAFNMPARYAVSYLPDIGVTDDGLPPDFHAYAEVWLEGGWHIFDPHRLQARKGRIFIASGLDAADAAFATLYGAASLTGFTVWADPVDERGQKLDLTAPPRLAGPYPPLAAVA
jgi:transglutaminase-like putative cysteine protease